MSLAWTRVPSESTYREEGVKSWQPEGIGKLVERSKEGHTEASQSSEIMQPIFVKEDYEDRRIAGVKPHPNLSHGTSQHAVGGFSALEHYRGSPDPGWG